MPEQQKQNTEQLIMPDEVENQSLILPEEIMEEVANKQSEAEPREEIKAKIETNQFTTSQAREALDETRAGKMPMFDEDNNPEADRMISPIFWLVGTLCFLAVLIFVIWVLAR